MWFVVFVLSLCAGILSFMYSFPLAASSLSDSGILPAGIKTLTEKLSSSITALLGESNVMAVSENTSYNYTQDACNASYLLVFAGLIGITASLMFLLRRRGSAEVLLLVSAVLCGAAIYFYGCGYIFCALFVTVVVLMFRMRQNAPSESKPVPKSQDVHTDFARSVQPSGTQRAVNINNDGIQVQAVHRIPKRMNIHVGLGWIKSTQQKVVFDLDLSALPVRDDGTARAEDLLFYNTNVQDVTHGNSKKIYMLNDNGKIYMKHTGDDECGGSGRKDNETITVYLSQVPAAFKRIIFTVTIKRADLYDPRLTFGQISRTYVRVCTCSKFFGRIKDTFITYHPNMSCSHVDSVYCGILERNTKDPRFWNFIETLQPYSGGILGLCNNFGLRVQSNSLPK